MTLNNDLIDELYLIFHNSIIDLTKKEDYEKICDLFNSNLIYINDIFNSMKISYEFKNGLLIILKTPNYKLYKIMNEKYSITKRNYFNDIAHEIIDLYSIIKSIVTIQNEKLSLTEKQNLIKKLIDLILNFSIHEKLYI